MNCLPLLDICCIALLNERSWCVYLNKYINTQYLCLWTLAVCLSVHSSVCWSNCDISPVSVGCSLSGHVRPSGVGGSRHCNRLIIISISSKMQCIFSFLLTESFRYLI